MAMPVLLRKHQSYTLRLFASGKSKVLRMQPDVRAIKGHFRSAIRQISRYQLFRNGTQSNKYLELPLRLWHRIQGAENLPAQQAAKQHCFVRLSQSGVTTPVENNTRRACTQAEQKNERVQVLERHETTLSKPQEFTLQVLRGKRRDYLRAMAKQFRELFTGRRTRTE